MHVLSTVGYPRIGANRELKRWVEAYFHGKLDRQALLANAAGLRRTHWAAQAARGITLLPSNDFSFYDGMLDMAALLGVVPESHRALGLDALDTYFAMAKGYQGPAGDVKALPMRKWFNTNYHYMVPTIDSSTAFVLNGTKPFDEYAEALAAGYCTKPVLIGPFTFLQLSRLTDGRTAAGCAEALADVYAQMLEKFAALGAQWVQLDEPALTADLSAEDVALFRALYGPILARKGAVKALLQTYFGDIRDVYDDVVSMAFDGVGLDFVEGERSLALVRRGFPGEKLLVAGVVSGRNIWRNDYAATMATLDELSRLTGALAFGTSCSLLHVPYTTACETALDPAVCAQFAFAEEKLDELAALARLMDGGAPAGQPAYRANRELLQARARLEGVVKPPVRSAVAALTEADFRRPDAFEQRAQTQRDALRLPPLPTTTIGSFPQTADVKELRKQLRRGALTPEQYAGAVRRKIDEVIALQEEIGLDVLVHGEYERNDMVEYFGENLEGFLFTDNGWVQSYGTRCVKPPIIFGDVQRARPITVDYIAYAQSRTSKPVKGMLTGPVTILNWSFPREDLTHEQTALQIALAIREEVADLERAGIGIIQIDEAALREKLPLRRQDWDSYLGWAIRAFRLASSCVRAETQIHTHMCYSEFGDIVREIDDMDADVITFEAARSDLTILSVLRKCGFRTAVGVGVYDIHSPRVPSESEIAAVLRRTLAEMPVEKVWVNPDCGLKTRGMEETVPSLKNMVAAARAVCGSLR